MSEQKNTLLHRIVFFRPAVAVDTVITVKVFFDWVLDEASPARMRGCWRQRRESSPRAGARPFGQRGLTPVFASNPGSPCD